MSISSEGLMDSCQSMVLFVHREENALMLQRSIRLSRVPEILFY